MHMRMEGGAEREGGRNPSRLQAKRGAQPEAQSHNPEITAQVETKSHTLKNYTTQAPQQIPYIKKTIKIRAFWKNINYYFKGCNLTI